MAEAGPGRRGRSRRLVRRGLIALALVATIRWVPLVPHTLYCWFDLPPIPPPYREAYLIDASYWLSRYKPSIPHLVFAGRVWLSPWDWLADTDSMNSNVFYKSAVSVAQFPVTVGGVTYPPPPEGVALAAEIRARGLAPSHQCAIVEIGATGRLRKRVPPG